MKRDFQADLTQLYEREKQAWIQSHPDVTPEEYEKAIRQIAEKLGY